jgi:hypothetical protein
LERGQNWSAHTLLHLKGTSKRLLEPNYPGRPAPEGLEIEENTPFKSIFRQMADMPATVLSFSLPPDSGELATIFFIRSAFTVSQFRREIERPI